jgi:DivIVA domain-containing protein
MDQDDPENRIAALERQLAEQKNMAEPEHLEKRPVVTPEDVHNVAFSKPPIGKRGYNGDEVDYYLERIEATLRDPTASGGVTPADIRNVAFSKPPIGQRGYNGDEVDAFLDRVEIELTRRLEEPGLGGPQDFCAPAGLAPQLTFPGEPGLRAPRWVTPSLGIISNLFVGLFGGPGSGRFLPDWILPVFGVIFLALAAVTGSVSDLRWGIVILIGTAIYVGFRLVRERRHRRQSPAGPRADHRK